ncbi:MAG: glycosyltransferase family 2 protein [Deltaproteobacteria bacterium]|nr:glycosyltransferase family 2 protein [Deltaproteobacteria bacterium]
MSPLVSVVLPTHDRAPTIRRAAESVLSQSFSDFELIIVDDASRDGTLSVLSELRDPRLSIVRRPSRGGGAAARNSGILAARGALVAFQDSDDVWDPEKLRRQVELLDGAGERVGFVYTGFTKRGGLEDGVTIPEDGIYPEGSVLDRILLRNFVSTQTALVRKPALVAVKGFDEALPRLQDWDLFIRLARRHEARAVKESLVDVFYSDRSISADESAYFLAYERILRKLSGDSPAIRKHHLRVLSRAALVSGRKKKAIEYAIAANRLGTTKTELRLLASALTSESAWDELMGAWAAVRRRAG